MNEELLSRIILETLESGDPDGQSWTFYENMEDLHHWTEDDAKWERGRFADIVIIKYQWAIEQEGK